MHPDRRKGLGMNKPEQKHDQNFQKAHPTFWNDISPDDDSEESESNARYNGSVRRIRGDEKWRDEDGLDVERSEEDAQKRIGDRSKDEKSRNWEDQRRFDSQYYGNWIWGRGLDEPGPEKKIKELGINGLMWALVGKKPFSINCDEDLDDTLSVFDTLKLMCEVTQKKSLKKSLWYFRQIRWVIKHENQRDVDRMMKKLTRWSDCIIVRIRSTEYFQNGTQ